MVDFATTRILKFRISNVPNLDHARLDIDDTTILAHHITPDAGTTLAIGRTRHLVETDNQLDDRGAREVPGDDR